VTARPAAGVVLCRLDAIENPGAKGFRFREGEAEWAGFVLRRGDGVVGYVDSCPHAGWPLAMFDRYLTREKDMIVCSGHGALFSLDGTCVAGPCAGDRLEAWPVEVVGEEVVTA
jgi:nitrite reductase/ring-hydroxylating ferredoxin subunit